LHVFGAEHDQRDDNDEYEFGGTDAEDFHVRFFVSLV
jgi:hypothetical protein